MNNIILNTDSYKASHWLQYPPGTEKVFSYIESRGGKYPKSVFFGLQMFLKEYLSRPVTVEMVEEAEAFFAAHGEPFNKEGWMRLIEKHNGYFPVKIKAVPEGMVVPVKNVLATIENTDPEFFWVTSYLETALLRAIWYPTTVATNSWSIKQLIKAYLEYTGDVNQLNFKLHDFGSRGVSSMESAGIGGAAHLVNFLGTDTISGVIWANKFYNAGVAGFSIPAAEHSTMTSWGGEAGEIDAMRNMLAKFAKPGALVAIVSDSYHIYKAISEKWGKELKQEIINSGATIVIRPDSGNPVKVVMECLSLLKEAFGVTINDKGYKVLPPYIRLIQGDGINEQSINDILWAMENNGFSADNIAFGMGGALLQQVNRDTMKFAMKASAIKVNGEWRDVFKDPITDKGKASKSGRLTLYKNVDGTYETLRIGEIHDHIESEVLELVFRDGKILKEYNFNEVRLNTGI